MIEALVFPDTRDVLFDLINGANHLGSPVKATTWLSRDAYDTVKGTFPLAHIYSMPGGREGFIDRADRLTIDVYAPGQKALQTLESIRASIVGDSIETPSGYVDSITCDAVPAEVPFQSETLNKATASFLVTSRPIN